MTEIEGIQFEEIDEKLEVTLDGSDAYERTLVEKDVGVAIRVRVSVGGQHDINVGIAMYLHKDGRWTELVSRRPVISMALVRDAANDRERLSEAFKEDADRMTVQAAKLLFTIYPVRAGR